MKHEVLTSVLVLALSLTACGGGAGNDDWASSDPSARAISASSFDIQDAWTNLNNAPYASQLKAHGPCPGTYILSNSTANIAGVQVMANVVSTNIAYGAASPCDSPYENKSAANITNIYYYYAVVNSQYKNYYAYDNLYVYVWRAVAAFPTSAKVGDAGVIGVVDKYTSSNSAKVGIQVWSYAIEEDTAYSVIFNLIAKHYDTTTTSYASAPLGKTEQFRYLVNLSNGVNQLQLIQYDRLDADGFTVQGRLN